MNARGWSSTLLVSNFRILSKIIYKCQVCFQYVIVIAVFVVGEAVALGLLYGKPELVSLPHLIIAVEPCSESTIVKTYLG